MRYTRFILSAPMVIIGLLLLTACEPDEPTQIGGFALTTVDQEVPQAKSQPICRAIEDAGYLMPYGDPFVWYEFKIYQPYEILSGPYGTLLSVPHGQPHLIVLADWPIPSNFDNTVSQGTIESLSIEAKKICRIVQQEGQKQGIGPVKVSIRLWDFDGSGSELSYGSANSAYLSGPDLAPTSDCEHITGTLIAHSIGLNPAGRTPNKCPSLYVPG